MTELRDIVDSDVAPLLKNAGFKKARYIWNRRREEFVDVIELQLGRGSEKDNGYFTLNAGVCVPEWVELVWTKPLGKMVREAECPVGGRVAAITANFSKDTLDKWWEISSKADAATVGNDVVTAINHHVLPFLKSISTISDIHTFLSNGSGWKSSFPIGRIYLAIAKAKLGDHNGADHVLQSVMEENPDSWATNALRVQKLLAKAG